MARSTRCVSRTWLAAPLTRPATAALVLRLTVRLPGLRRILCPAQGAAAGETGAGLLLLNVSDETRDEHAALSHLSLRRRARSSASLRFTCARNSWSTSRSINRSSRGLSSMDRASRASITSPRLADRLGRASPPPSSALLGAAAPRPPLAALATFSGGGVVSRAIVAQRDQRELIVAQPIVAATAARMDSAQD